MSRPDWLWVIGLGTSQGDRLTTLTAALYALDTLPGVTLLRASGLYESPPAGGIARGRFLNGAALIQSKLGPLALLAACQGLEARFGRRRKLRWSDRTLDLDLLWTDAMALDLDVLKVPHPLLTERPFAWRPLLDVLPEARDPGGGLPYARLQPEGPLPGLSRVGVLPNPHPSALAIRPEPVYPNALRPRGAAPSPMSPGSPP